MNVFGRGYLGVLVEGRGVESGLNIPPSSGLFQVIIDCGAIDLNPHTSEQNNSEQKPEESPWHRVLQSFYLSIYACLHH